MTDIDQLNPDPQEYSARPIVATAGRYYRRARYIMVAAILFAAGYFLYDGYIRYPANNAEIERVEREMNEPGATEARKIELKKQRDNLGAHRDDLAIRLQKILGYSLPFPAIAYLLYFLHKSRGKIALADGRLEVPGHPPVPLSAVTGIDDNRWEKKGISYVRYTQGGRNAVLVLDDFVYQQKPIDAIHAAVVAAIGGRQTASTTVETFVDTSDPLAREDTLTGDAADEVAYPVDPPVQTPVRPPE